MHHSKAAFNNYSCYQQYPNQLFFLFSTDFSIPLVHSFLSTTSSSVTCPSILHFQFVSIPLPQMHPTFSYHPSLKFKSQLCRAALYTKYLPNFFHRTLFSLLPSTLFFLLNNSIAILPSPFILQEWDTSSLMKASEI